MLKKRKGFTLIELLIVITIIGILAVALVPRLTGGPARARDAQRKADLQQIATALEFYYDDYGYYPAAVSGCIADLSSYLTSVPSDPSGTGAESCAGDYGYNPLTVSPATTPNGYLLSATLETKTAVGDGIYEDTFAITSTDSASDNFTTNDTAGRDCSAAGDCTTPTYYVGR